MTETANEWVFEGPDPDVGIFGDLVVHCCRQNVDEVEATLESKSLTKSTDGKHVVEVIRFTCPACSATTTATETWPASMFEDEPV